MRLMADESVEAPVVQGLRTAGFDVIAIAEVSSGDRDERVLGLAESQGAILITNDKDFAHLALDARGAANGLFVLFTADRGLVIESDNAQSDPIGFKAIFEVGCRPAAAMCARSRRST
jgi:predicted nuclease of predicted toxin-antitoxin system